MNPSPLFSLFLPLLFLISFLTLTRSQTLINSTCQTLSRDDPNINFNFCKTSLQAAPASRCANLSGIGMIAIRLVRYNVTDTRCEIKQLLKTAKLEPYVRSCLNDCFELFTDAIDSVKQAMKSYNAQKFDDANIQISSVMDAATTCEDGFKDRKGVVSPLSKKNNDTFQLSAVVLNVMHLIQRGST